MLGSEGIHCSKEKPLPAVRARPSPGQVSPERPGPASADLGDFPCIGQTRAEEGSACQRGTAPSVQTSRSPEHRGAASGTSLDREQLEGSGATPEAKVDQTCRGTAARASAVNSVLPRSSAVGGVLRTKQQLKPPKPSDLANGVLADSLGQEPLPPLRRGRKRHCKTKHLEQNGSLKKLRAAGGEAGLAPAEPVLRELEQRARQEEEDRRLALRLQRVFDGERRAVSRRKGSVDQYLLRSSNVAGAK